MGLKLKTRLTRQPPKLVALLSFGQKKNEMPTLKHPQKNNMEHATYVCIGYATAIVLLGLYADRKNLDRKLWLRKILAGLIAVWMLSQLDAIDTAGLKATEARVQAHRWNEDYRDGVLTTMQGITPGNFMFKFYILVLLGLAVIPLTRKSEDSSNMPGKAA